MFSLTPYPQPPSGGHSGSAVGAMISWVVSGALALVGVRVVDPRNPLRVRAGLHVELLGVMNYSECKPLSRVPGVCVWVEWAVCVKSINQ